MRKNRRMKKLRKIIFGILFDNKDSNESSKKISLLIEGYNLDLKEEIRKKEEVIIRLKKENKQLKLYKELYIKLRKQFDEYNKHNKKQKADFIKRLKEGEIKTTEQIMRCELDILKGIESEGERENFMDDYGHKIKWINFDKLIKDFGEKEKWLM